MDEYLYKLSKFFPLYDFEVSEYFKKLSNTININYENNEYQFSYIGVHLLLMTYLYFIVWQISKMSNKMYELTALFARPFNGSEINFDGIESIFDFKDLPEKEVINFLYLIGFDKSYLTILKKQIEIRNAMAHASGTYDILEEEPFKIAVDNVISIFEKCHKNICDNLLLKEYSNQLYIISHNKIDNDSISEFVENNLITELSLSYTEISYIMNLGKNKVCSVMEGLSAKEYVIIKKAHLLVQKVCVERYLEQ
ncbi:MAG: hypothetical protein PHP29_08395 [Tissierellia bacterium]|nr:hypothetical protein [Tissierellia bacterium]